MFCGAALFPYISTLHFFTFSDKEVTAVVKTLETRNWCATARPAGLAAPRSFAHLDSACPIVEIGAFQPFITGHGAVLATYLIVSAAATNAPTVDFVALKAFVAEGVSVVAAIFALVATVNCLTLVIGAAGIHVKAGNLAVTARSSSLATSRRTNTNLTDHILYLVLGTLQTGVTIDSLAAILILLSTACVAQKLS
jgi:hypothetical protein